MVSIKKDTTAGAHALSLLEEHLKQRAGQEGSRLPPERQLASDLGISRRALRDALSELEAQGQIWRGVGQGTFIGRRPLELPTNLSSIKNLTSPSELMEARLALEPPIAALATIHATKGDLEEAWRCWKKSSGVGNAKAWEFWDGSLHRSIAHSTHNTLLIALFDALNSVRAHTDWGRLRRESLNPVRQQLYTTQHLQILTAVSDRDADGAASAMKSHLLTVKRDLLGV